MKKAQLLFHNIAKKTYIMSICIESIVKYASTKSRKYHEAGCLKFIPARWKTNLQRIIYDIPFIYMEAGVQSVLCNI